MRLYLDTSALVKLIIREPESEALQGFLNEWGTDELCTAALSRTELLRAVAGGGPAATAQARDLLDAVDSITLTRSLLDDAGGLKPMQLRSLDAIHLASAMRAGNTLRAVVTYDARMTDAAERLGIATAAPT
jgi:predicted nucleic acid-binding protein